MRSSRSSAAELLRHQQERIHHHQLSILCASKVVAVFVSAADPVARVSKFARSFRVDVKTPVSVSTLGEEFALTLRVVVLALLGTEVAFGPVFAPHLLLLSLLHRVLLL